MAQNLFGTLTSPSLPLLDANFTELYGLYALISPSGGALLATADVQVGKAQPNLILSQSAAGQGAYLALRTAGSARWVWGALSSAEAGSNAGSELVALRYSDGGSYLGVALQSARADGSLAIGGQCKPYSDDAHSLGASTSRWSIVYSATGTINTSDAREKTSVQSLTAAELRAAKALAREIGGFQFLSSVQSKGDAARRHIGMTVQRAMEILQAEGLDPEHYAFICHDKWPEQVTPAITEQRPTQILGQDGQPVFETVVLQPAETSPAGDRYGFRTDELLLFIARGLEARLTALEDAAA